MEGKARLIAHLATGATTTCRAWRVTRRDGRSFGFTDHDRDLAFENTLFKADSGLRGAMLQQTTGLAVDNTEVLGALSDDAISEVDLIAGRFDGAEVVTWLVNWRAVEERMIRFRGSFGEIHLSNGSFRVELRGLTERLNQANGRVYQPSCSAILGDRECRVDLTQVDLTLETTIKGVGRSGEYFVSSQPAVPDHSFDWGRALLVSGRAAGLTAAIRDDRETGLLRAVRLMVDFNLSPEVGDTIQLRAGCDKTGATCRGKFDNFANFRGFPHIPGTDWLTAFPTASQRNDGGSRFK